MCKEKRVCSRCKKEKIYTEFSFKNKAKDRRNSSCKDCMKLYRKEHYNRNKDYYIEKAKLLNEKVRERNQKIIIDYLLKNPCVGCGQDNILVLDFDHIDRSSKTNEVSKMITMSVKTLTNEIKKCQVLCANCHRIKTAKESDNYKLKYISA